MWNKLVFIMAWTKEKIWYLFFSEFDYFFDERLEWLQIFIISLHVFLKIANNNSWEIKLDIHYALHEHLCASILIFIIAHSNFFDINLCTLLIDFETLAFLFFLTFKDIKLIFQFVFYLTYNLSCFKMSVRLHFSLLCHSFLNNFTRESFSFK